MPYGGKTKNSPLVQLSLTLKQAILYDSRLMGETLAHVCEVELRVVKISTRSKVYVCYVSNDIYFMQNGVQQNLAMIGHQMI